MVGPLGHQPGTHQVSIVHVDGTAERCRNQHVTVNADQRVAIQSFHARCIVVNDRAPRLADCVHCVRIHAIGRVQRAFHIAHGDDLRTCCSKEMRGPVAHVAEPLYGDTRSLQRHAHVGGNQFRGPGSDCSKLTQPCAQRTWPAAADCCRATAV